MRPPRSMDRPSLLECPRQKVLVGSTNLIGFGSLMTIEDLNWILTRNLGQFQQKYFNIANIKESPPSLDSSFPTPWPPPSRTLSKTRKKHGKIIQGGPPGRILRLSWLRSEMFHHLAHLLSQFCHFPIGPSRSRQRVEQQTSKSTQLSYQTRWATMYVHFTMIVSFGNEGPLLILSHILPIKCITRTSEKHILID